MTRGPDGWVAGATYEDFMGRWSRQLAPAFVTWLAIPAGEHWLDVGCGTGALTAAICRLAHPASVLGCDPASPFIEYARRHLADARATFVVGGADSLPRRPDGYGSVSSLLALNFFPDPVAAIREMRAACRPGGIVSACVWDYAGKMEFLRRFWDAVGEEDPAARELDEGVRFPICHPEALSHLFDSAGLSHVGGGAIEIPTRFASFSDFWRPLLGGTGPAAAYVTSLDEERRDALARRLESGLSQGRSGDIVLVARAWAVRGTVR